MSTKNQKKSLDEFAKTIVHEILFDSLNAARVEMTTRVTSDLGQGYSFERTYASRDVVFSETGHYDQEDEKPKADELLIEGRRGFKSYIQEHDENIWFAKVTSDEDKEFELMNESFAQKRFLVVNGYRNPKPEQK